MAASEAPAACAWPARPSQPSVKFGRHTPALCLQPTAESSSGSAGPATVEDLQRVFKAFAMFGTGAMVASPAGSRQKVGDLRMFAQHAAEASLNLFVPLHIHWGDQTARHNIPATSCCFCSLTECDGSFSADHQLNHCFLSGPFVLTPTKCPPQTACYSTCGRQTD